MILLVSTLAFFALVAGLWAWTAYERSNAHLKKRPR